MNRPTARAAWKRIWRETRLIGRGDTNGRRQFGLILQATGARSAWDGKAGLLAMKIQALLSANSTADRESDRYKRTRTVLNSFGRLNPWRGGAGCYRDSVRVRTLRARLLASRRIAPEPGGYVTGLLDVAPAKMWWHDYPTPVAALSRDDVALYEGETA